MSENEFTPGPWLIKTADVGDEVVCVVPIEIRSGQNNFPIVYGVDGRRKHVPAWPVRSKDFVITETPYWRKAGRPRYTLTHVKSGYRVGRAGSRKPLRILAAVYAALPVPWSQIKLPSDLTPHWNLVPTEIREWRIKYANNL